MTTFVMLIGPLLLLLAFLAVGGQCWRRIETPRQFLLGVSQMTSYTFAANIFAANFSFLTAVFVLLYWSYTYGFHVYWAIGSAILGFVLYAIPKMSPAPSSITMKSKTLHEFIAGDRPQNRLLRGTSACVSVFTLMGFLVAQVSVFANVLAVYVPLSPHLLALLLFVVLLAYCLGGGFEAVIRTDWLQIGVILRL